MNFSMFRTFVRDPWALGYLAFLAGFFILPYEQGRVHRNGFALYMVLFLGLALKDINWKPINVPLLAFSLCYLFLATISLFGSVHFEVELLIKYALISVSVAVFLLIPAYLEQKLPLSAAELFAALMLVLIPIAAASTLYSSFSYYQSHDLWERLVFFGRLDGPITHSVVNALLILGSISVANETKNRWLRVGMIAGALVLLLGILLSQSRGPLMAVGIASVLQLGLLQMYRSLAIMLIGIGMSAILLYTNADLVQLAISRGSSFRPEIWQTIWHSMPDHLIFGHSILPEHKMTIPILGEVHHAHNIWMSTFYYLGVLGLLIHIGLVVVWCSVCASVKSPRMKALASAMFIFSLINYCVDGGLLLTKPDALWWGIWWPISWVLVSGHQESLVKLFVERR